MSADNRLDDPAGSVEGTETSKQFVDYYTEASADESTRQRFEAIRRLAVAAIGEERYKNEKLAVADCIVGTQLL